MSGRLRPQDVRDATFAQAPRRRGGLDPDQVYAFLGQVADEMTRLQHELNAAMTDAARVKNALHEWQVQHAATCAQAPMARPAPPPPPMQPPMPPPAQPGYGSGYQPHPGGGW